MNRKQKIIVSVTGIFLVLLILMGLTYAYFLTQIKGNTKPSSISVTTANLVLNYGDGNGVLEVGDKLRPGNAVNFKTSNGTTVNEKTFTVTNSGDNTSYVVIVDNVNVTPEPFKTNDFRYALTCKSYTTTDYNTNGVGATEIGKCDGVTSSIFYLKNQSILVGNKIDAGITHVYSLTMEYIDNGQNQSDDMGKTFTARINIEDIRRLDNPYASNTNSLAYNIINNSLNNTNGTELLSYPLTKVAEEVSKTTGTGEYEIHVATKEDGFYKWDYLAYGETVDDANSGATLVSDFHLSDDVALCNAIIGYHISDKLDCLYDCDYIGKVEDCTSDGKPVISKEIKEHEEILSTAQDDYGTSYYYRGNVNDNYVNFAEMCWRIVRIDGKGNIKLILEDQDNECKVSNGNWDIPASDGNSLTMNGDKAYITGNYGYELKNVDSDSSNESIMNYLNPVENKDRAMVNAFKYFQTKTLTNKINSKYNGKKLEDYLMSGNWCLGDKAYTRSGSSGSYEYTPLDSYNYSVVMYYDSYTRLVSENKNGYNPTYKCNGTALEAFNDSTPMYVATLTADEIVYAGGSWNDLNYNYYLMNDYSKYNINLWFWSLSPSSFYGSTDLAFLVVNDGYLDVSPVNFYDFAFRPSVSLKSGVEIENGGLGTKDKPYVIK